MAGKKYRKVRKKSTYVSKGTGSKIVHTGYGSIAKKRISRGKPRNDLYKDTRKLVLQTNARISSLQRHFKKGTWASKTLYNKLGTKKINIGKRGKLSLPKNLTKTELTAINKALSQFFIKPIFSFESEFLNECNIGIGILLGQFSIGKGI